MEAIDSGSNKSETPSVEPLREIQNSVSPRTKTLAIHMLRPSAYKIASTFLTLHFAWGGNKFEYPPAEYCNPETLEGCKGRQAEFAERMRDEPLAWQIRLLEMLRKRPRYEDEAEWLDDQIIILENVIEYTKATRGEEL